MGVEVFSIKAVIIDIPLLSDVIIGLRTIKRIKLFKYLPELVEDEDESESGIPKLVYDEEDEESEMEETEEEWNTRSNTHPEI
jgi:hypothetical protein